MKREELIERQKDLHRRYQGGDRRAHAELVETCAGLVYKLASGAYKSGIPRDDIVSEGMLGVCEAIECFDPKRGNLSAIAYRKVQRRIDILSRTMSRSVAIPRSRREDRIRWHLSRKVSEYESEGFSTQRAIELAAHDIGVSPGHAEAAIAMRSSPKTRISACSDDSGRDDDIITRLMSDGEPIDEALDGSRIRSVISDAMAGLDDRERRLVSARMLSDEPVSLDDLGAELGMSRKTATTMLSHALEHMRIEMRSKGLELSDLIAD